MKSKKGYLLFVPILFFGILLPVCMCYIKNAGKEGSLELSLLYVGNSNLVEAISGSDMLEIRQMEAIPEKECSGCTNMIVDKEYLGEENRALFVAAIQNGIRILILGDVPEKELREYFGFDVKKTDEYPDAAGSGVWVKEDTQKSMLLSSLLGTVVYRSGQEDVISRIFVQNSDETKIVEKAIRYCFEHDYAGQMAHIGDLESVSWKDSVMYRYTYILDELSANVMLKVKEYKEAPNASGQYLALISCTAEIDPADDFAVQYAEIEIGGTDTSQIYEWKVESLGGKHKVKTIKRSGGIDNPGVRVRYQPETVLGTYICERNFMSAGIVVETYRNAEAVDCVQGSFTVKMRELNGFGFSCGKGMTYTITLSVGRDGASQVAMGNSIGEVWQGR